MGERVAEVVLAALYLRGAPRAADPPKRGWPGVVAALRRERPSLGEAASVLRKAGATLPATLLDSGGLMAWAEEAVEEGYVLTAVSSGYPRRWLEGMGESAAPAFWRSPSGVLEDGGSWVGAVGSREVSSSVEDYLAEVAAQAGRLGHGILSGGAMGCDSAAERAALHIGTPVLRLLPHGLRFRCEDDGAVQLSLAAPDEPFSRALAMERNALIYGGAQVTVVGHARLRAGGTWHGATEALRRRLGHIVVRPDDSAAVRALRALGAGQLSDPKDLSYALASAPAQTALFAFENSRVCENRKPASLYDSPAFAM
jgi:predicted Rossmann fold nucleotide-binding protein DprA/Smf involved in DNA uptake